MGCKTQGEPCTGGFLGGVSTSNCAKYRPGEGVTFEFREYPPAQIRTGNYNIPDRDGNAVMYNSIEVTPPSGRVAGTQLEASSGANCGKVSLTSPCNAQGTLIFDYYPNALSFDYGISDTWFSYLYDTSDDAGVAGTPCYHLEERRNSTTTTTTTQTPPSTSTSTTTETTTICHPCTAFYCTPAETNLRYSADEDLTGDPDCPHPTLFAFGTNSNKIAFSYNQLSTEVPDGVVDFSVSYDGVTYADAWDEGALQGFAYESTQNPWLSGDEAFADFEIFEIDTPPTATGLRLKVYIEPIFDDTGASVVFSGTRWTIAEVLSPGTGYAVNDVFQLAYVHTHPDNTQSTLSLNLKVTAVGPIPITEGQEGFDLLRAGDTLNGHTITRVFHTDVDNFPYHVAYVDGDGNDFVKDTQYTSDRNHIVTVKAGFAIPDRAIVVGLYEFLGKSVQYVTLDVDKNAPDTFNTLVQPEIDVTVTNGRVSGLTIVDGGSGWNTLGKEPELQVTTPAVSSGTQAVVEGTFTAGVLTSIEIKEPGSGYTSADVYVRNIFQQVTESYANEGYRSDLGEDFVKNAQALPEGDYKASQETLQQITDAAEFIPKEFSSNRPTTGFQVKKDPERNRITVLPQALYSKGATDPIREYMKPKYDLKYIEDAPLDDATKQYIINEKQRLSVDGQKLIDDITQPIIPEFKTEKEVLVETVQGSLTALPKASEFTKYMIRQYRPDTRTSLNIQFTLSCSPVDSGCGHFACTAPGVTPGGTTTDPTETDPETGDTTDSSTTTTYTMSGLLGDGCKSWSISGSMKMFNNLTGSGQTVLRAVEAYGNPYDV